MGAHGRQGCCRAQQQPPKPCIKHSPCQTALQTQPGIPLELIKGRVGVVVEGLHGGLGCARDQAGAEPSCCVIGKKQANMTFSAAAGALMTRQTCMTGACAMLLFSSTAPC